MTTLSVIQKSPSPKDRVENALRALRGGNLIILCDDESRENEGDFVLLADKATPGMLNFMITHGRGLVCLAMAPALVDQLELPLMVSNNESSFGTSFTVSINAKKGITTGISAYDRACTIRTAVRPGACREDLAVPGHIFPLRARGGGLVDRQGHTEGSVELAKLCGAQPAAVICEVLNVDGTMARLPELQRISQEFDIPILTIEELTKYVADLSAIRLGEPGILEGL